ncbi:MAG: Tad domain-containing protein [candidate division WOR-3 bacterium]
MNFLTNSRRKLESLQKDNNGQVLVLVISILFVLVLFFITIPNVTKVVATKMRVQTAADIGAYSSSIWVARGMNLINFCNIGIAEGYIIQDFYKSFYSILSILWTLGYAFPQFLGWLHPVVDYIMSVFFYNQNGIPIPPIAPYDPGRAYDGLKRDMDNIAETQRLLQQMAIMIGNATPGFSLAKSLDIISRNTSNIPGCFGLAVLRPESIVLQEDNTNKLQSYINDKRGTVLGILSSLSVIVDGISWLIGQFDPNNGVKYVQSITVKQWYHRLEYDPGPPARYYWVEYSNNPVTMTFYAGTPQNPYPQPPIEQAQQYYSQGASSSRLPNAPSSSIWELYDAKPEKHYTSYTVQQPSGPSDKPKPMRPINNYNFYTFAFIYHHPTAPIVGRSHNLFGDSPGYIPGLVFSQARPYLDSSNPIDSLFGMKWDAKLDSITAFTDLIQTINNNGKPNFLTNLSRFLLLH